MLYQDWTTIFFEGGTSYQVETELFCVWLSTSDKCQIGNELQYGGLSDWTTVLGLQVYQDWISVWELQALSILNYCFGALNHIMMNFCLRASSHQDWISVKGIQAISRLNYCLWVLPAKTAILKNNWEGSCDKYRSWSISWWCFAVVKGSDTLALQPMQHFLSELGQDKCYY